MLVDPKEISADLNGIGAILAVIGGGDPQPRRICLGMYEISHFSFDHCLSNVVSFPRDVDGSGGWWLRDPDIGEYQNPKGGYPHHEFSCCGVCDSPDQFRDHDVGKWIIGAEKGYVVSFSKIVKANQSPEGGWRWDRWGPYIGVHEPKCEYIYDEGDEIQEVYCYYIYECLSEEAVAEIVNS